MAKKQKLAKVRSKKPKAQALPGMEDHAIKPLDDIATAYADIRDERMELTEREHTLKLTAIKLMKKYGKTVYRHNGHEILLVQGEDGIKVRAWHVEGEPAELPDDDMLDNVDIAQTDERRRAVDEDEPDHANTTGE